MLLQIIEIGHNFMTLLLFLDKAIFDLGNKIF